MRWPLLFVSMLAACESGTDVVARLSDSGALETSAGHPRPTDATCEAPMTLTVLTKLLDVHRYDLAAETSFDTVSMKDCLMAMPGPIAVDRSGNLWTAASGTLVVSDASGAACKPMPLKLTPTAMAFVWDKKLGREMLYAIEEDVLYGLDPLADGYATSLVGKLSPPIDDLRGLAGTSDGKLFAFAGDLVISISRVNVDDASVDPLWITKNPDRSRFAGGVPSKSGFELIFGARAFAFDAASGAGPQLHMPLFPNDEGTLYVTAPPCFLSTN